MGVSRMAMLGAVALAGASALAPAAQAQDFFSALFGGMGRAQGALYSDAVCQ